MVTTQLFTGKNVEITPVDPEKDSIVESLWTFNLEYTRHFNDRPPRPMAAFELKKYMEEAQKESEEKQRSFIFAVRLKKEKDRLIGMVRITHMEWNNQIAHLLIHFHDPVIEKLYFGEVIHLVLQFLFGELNMHYVGIMTIASDQAQTIALYEQAGFRREVTLQKSLFRDGKFINEIILGILRREWEGYMNEI